MGCGPADKTDVSSVPVNMTTAVISFIVVVFWGEGGRGAGRKWIASVCCIGKNLMKFKEGHSEEGMGGGGFPRASLEGIITCYETVRRHGMLSIGPTLTNIKAGRPVSD